MARNVEIKARVRDREKFVRLAAGLSGQPPQHVKQDDTFFQCPNGRIKLRELAPDRGELVFYRRADQVGPKESFYLVSSTSDPDGLRRTLAEAYGADGRVKKERDVYMVGRTRVHLDVVEGLGDFMELEVVLADGESVKGGQDEAEELQNKLGIAADDLIHVAYVDLLKAADSHGASGEGGSDDA